MRIGVLALQGAVTPHQAKLESLGAHLVRVRLAADLDDLDGLILPGGESTTMLKLIHAYGLWDALKAFGARAPVWGICAGCILLAETVENPAQPSLGLLPITVRRNAFGRQNESFIAPLALEAPGAQPVPTEGVFIRAPQIITVKPGVRVLARYAEQPVAVESPLAGGAIRHLGSVFHPELAAGNAWHAHFLGLCAKK